MRMYFKKMFIIRVSNPSEQTPGLTARCRLTHTNVNLALTHSSNVKPKGRTPFNVSDLHLDKIEKRETQPLIIFILKCEQELQVQVKLEAHL